MGSQPHSNWWTGHGRGLLPESGVRLPQRGRGAREAKPAGVRVKGLKEDTGQEVPTLECETCVKFIGDDLMRL